MKKIYISLGFILTLIVSLFAMIPINTDELINPWMSKLSDDTLITDMSIPGSHDSGASHSFFDIAGKCQDLSVKKQVDIGVRFFDLRLQMVNDEFKIVHSFVDQNLKFKSVIKDLYNFISEYNEEFLIISIKKEADDINSSLDFEDLLKQELNPYQDLISFDNSLPNSLRECRGKIFIMSRYNLSFGIPSYQGWSDDDTFTLNNMYIQDNYCVNSALEKIEDIKKTIEIKNSFNNQLVLNFTSCYLDNGFPPTYAGSMAKEINPWLSDYINNNNNLKLGITISDFVNEELVSLIIGSNF